MRTWLRALFVAWLAACCGVASAHEMTMAEMQVRETAPGEFLWQWTATNELAPSAKLNPMWPEGCRAEGARRRV